LETKDDQPCGIVHNEQFNDFSWLSSSAKHFTGKYDKQKNKF